MTVKTALQTQSFRPSAGGIRNQYLSLLIALGIIAILVIAWLAVGTIEALGKSAMDIGKMAALDQSVLDEMQDALDQNLQRFIFSKVLPFSLLILGIGFAAGWFWMNRLVKSIKEMTLSTQSVIKGNREVTFPVQSMGEAGNLARTLQILVDQNRADRLNLEKQITDQKQILEIRRAQLTAMAHVAREAAASRQFEHLLDRSVNLIRDRFNYYHAGIFLVDPSRQNIVLRAASGETGQKMLLMGHRLKIGQTSIVGFVASTGISRQVPNTLMDAAFFKNPLLPDTHSEIALPLRVGQRTLGVLDVQRQQAGSFDEEESIFLQTIADQLSVTLDNASLSQQYQESLEKLDLLRQQEQPSLRFSHLSGRVQGFQFDLTGVRRLEVKEAPQSNSVEDSDRSIMQVPVLVRGEKVATIKIWPDQEEIPIQDARLVNDIREKLSQAIESAQLFDETQVRAKREQYLNQLSTSLSQSLDLNVLLKQAVRELSQMPNVTEATIILCQPAESS
jgi:GAF domain-containing protein